MARDIIDEMKFVNADWNDAEGLAESFEEALKELGLFVYADPFLEGSDTLGFIIVPYEASTEEIKEGSSEFWDEYEDEDEDEEIPGDVSDDNYDNRGLDQIGEDISTALEGFSIEIADIMKEPLAEEKLNDRDYMENLLYNWMEQAGVDIYSDLTQAQLEQYIDEGIAKARTLV